MGPYLVLFAKKWLHLTWRCRRLEPNDWNTRTASCFTDLLKFLDIAQYMMGLRAEFKCPNRSMYGSISWLIFSGDSMVSRKRFKMLWGNQQIANTRAKSNNIQATRLLSLTNLELWNIKRAKMYNVLIPIRRRLQKKAKRNQLFN